MLPRLGCPARLPRGRPRLRVKVAADDEAAAPQRAHRRHQEHRVRRRPRLRQQVADRPHRRRVVAVP